MFKFNKLITLTLFLCVGIKGALAADLPKSVQSPANSTTAATISLDGGYNLVIQNSALKAGQLTQSVTITKNVNGGQKVVGQYVFQPVSPNSETYGLYSVQTNKDGKSVYTEVKNDTTTNLPQNIELSATNQDGANLNVQFDKTISNQSDPITLSTMTNAEIDNHSNYSGTQVTDQDQLINTTNSYEETTSPQNDLKSVIGAL